MENERCGYDNSLCKNHAVRPISGSDVILLKESDSTDTSAAAYATVSYDGR